RRRLWLAGIGATLLGYAAQASALGVGRLTLVEPVLASTLLVALVAAAVWTRRRLRVADAVAALGCAAGLALFLTVADPHGGRRSAPVGQWALALAGVGVVLAVVAGLGPRLAPRARAGALAVLAGCAFGCTDGLTKDTITVLGHLHFGVLADWPPYFLLVAGLTGFLAQQSAYHTAPLTASLPATAVLGPVIGSVIGLTLFRERLAVAGLGLPVVVGAALAMAVGVSVLARSPTIAAVTASAAAAGGGAEPAVTAQGRRAAASTRRPGAGSNTGQR
ncbi:MAG: DMT family transporter, partial [Mycobacteriales bacterium]